MNTIIIPVHQQKEPDPKCPHCGETLEGFSAPSDINFKEFVVAASIVIAVLSNGVGLFVGSMEGSFSKCDPFLSKRYHYVIPTFTGGCASVRWLTNKEIIFREVERD